ncbi:hypothetical protein D3C80_1166800 [compost metagenome]
MYNVVNVSASAAVQARSFARPHLELYQSAVDPSKDWHLPLPHVVVKNDESHNVLNHRAVTALALQESLLVLSFPRLKS